MMSASKSVATAGSAPSNAGANGQTATPVAGAVIPAPETSGRWADAELLPCQLSAEVKVERFTVRDLFCLEVNSVLDAGWSQSTDVPLNANSQVIAWAEFEVIGERLAVRLTELY
jgi:flagellar motor switch/type III secretory pathway protein FliN